MRFVALLLAALVACSSAQASVPPAWVSLTAPAHVTAQADGSYLWSVAYSYTDADDYVTQLTVTFALNGKAAPPTVIPVAQPNSLSQATTVKFPQASKGSTYDYSCVLTDQGGLKSDPRSGTVTLD